MEQPLVIALSKGRLLETAIALFKKVGVVPDKFSTKSRRLTFEDKKSGVKILLVRAVDVPTYVEYGAADIGIAGKDLLIEQMCDVYEPVDLKFGACRIVLAEADTANNAPNHRGYSKLRVATKYPNITERYFSEKGLPIEIIKLYGSIELAPLVGLADQIVDLSSSGETLRLHNLKVVDEIASCSARLVVNRASLKLKYPSIQKMIRDIKKVVGRKQELPVS